MRVTAPAPVTFLPESLFFLFSRPGRELTVRVVQIEGKTLTLETGGEKFQARIAGSLLPEDFRPGETLRIKVLSSGPPILLHILEGERLSEAEARFLKIFQEVQAEIPSLVSRFPVVSENPDLRPLLSFLLKFTESEMKKSSEVQRRKGSEEVEGASLREATSAEPKSEIQERETASWTRFVHLRQLLLPFVFADRSSWGFLETGQDRDTSSGESSLYLRLFLSELGLVEAFLRRRNAKLDLHFYFSRDEALDLARKYVPELKRDLAERGFWAGITLEKSRYEPGVILTKEG